MAEQRNVRPKPGIAFPRAAPYTGFVGYEVVQTGDASDEDHVVPGGPRYRPKEEPEQVPDSVYYRRALARGDIEDADSDEDEDEDEDEESGAPEVTHHADAHESEG